MYSRHSYLLSCLPSPRLSSCLLCRVFSLSVSFVSSSFKVCLSLFASLEQATVISCLDIVASCNYLRRIGSRTLDGRRTG